MSYAPLHVHTEHSALDGLARLDNLAAAAAGKGITAMAITDHGSLAGMWKWAQVCADHNIKPIPGIEAYMAIGSRFEKNSTTELDDEGMGDADDSTDGRLKTKRYHHLTILARNRTGFGNLIRFHNEAQKSVWYKPRGDMELLKECGEGLMVTTGCLGGFVAGPLKQVPLVMRIALNKTAASLADSLGGNFSISIDADGETVLVDFDDDAASHYGAQELKSIGDVITTAILNSIQPPAIGELGQHFVEAGLTIDAEAYIQLHATITNITEALGEQEKLRNKARDGIQGLIDAVGKDNVYVELMNHDIEAEIEATVELDAMAEEYGLLRVVTGDSHYIEAEDAAAHEAFLAVGSGATLADEKRFKFNGQGYHLKTYQEMLESCPFDDDEWQQLWKQAVDNTMAVADRVEDNTVPASQMRLPKFTQYDHSTGEFTPAEDSAALLRTQVEAGAVSRYGQNWREDQVRAERIERELQVITSMGFADYFLITQDVIDWCHSDRGTNNTAGKKSPIVTGLGRGSAAGSVVSYCLNIVGVDPLEADLLFERFLEPGRKGMPDIDLDFPASRRDEVFEYLQWRWGADRTARIGSATVARTKSALKDAARVLKPQDLRLGRAVFELGENMAKAVPMVGADPMPFAEMDQDKQLAHDYFTILDNDETLIDYQGQRVSAAVCIDALARAFEDITKSPGTHPCGFVISDEPIHNLLPLRYPTSGPADGSTVACFNGDDLEDMGFLKMDILGLENLDYLATTLENIEATTGQRISMEDIPHGNSEEQAAVDSYLPIQQGRTAGLFQLESSGMTQLAQDVGPARLNELSALLALYRPGPMGADMHHSYARRKEGHEEVSYTALTHQPEEQKWLSSVLGETYGLCIYQEQAMRLGRVVSGFDDAQRSTLRKAIGKKSKSLMDQCYDWWVSGATEEFRDESGEIYSPAFGIESAERIWDFIKASSEYSFNKSHSYAYGATSYITAYLKHHYPVEYAAAVLAHASKSDKRLATLNSLADEGIEVRPPNVNSSATDTAPRDGVVYYGLAEVKKVGKAAQSIVEQRPAGGYTSIEQLRSVKTGNRKLTKTHLMALCDSGALDDFGDRFEIRKSLEPKTEGRSPIAEAGRQLAVLGVILAENPLDKLYDADLLSVQADVEKRRHNGDDAPVRTFADGSIQDQTGGDVTRLGTSPTIPGSRVKVLGIITFIRPITTRAGKKMAVLQLLDGERRQELVVFPNSVTAMGGINAMPKVGDLVVVSGQLTDDRGDLKLFVKHIWSPDDPLEPQAIEAAKEAEAAQQLQAAQSVTAPGVASDRPVAATPGAPFGIHPARRSVPSAGAEQAPVHWPDEDFVSEPARKQRSANMDLMGFGF